MAEMETVESYKYPMTTALLGVEVKSRWSNSGGGLLVCTAVGEYPEDWEGERIKIGDVKPRIRKDGWDVFTHRISVRRKVSAI